MLGGACSEALARRQPRRAPRGRLRPRAARDGRDALIRRPARGMSVHTSAGCRRSSTAFPHGARAAPADQDRRLVRQPAGRGRLRRPRRRRHGPAALPGRPGLQPRRRADAVACGASSYHGPASTSPGGGTPLGAVAKGPTPCARCHVALLPAEGEDDPTFHGRMLGDFNKYLDSYEHEVGVLLIEPQWGSSVAGMPWPPALLSRVHRRGEARGIAVVCDEIMCGLGRHGAAPAPGGTGCFLSECWDLQPDIVTFGKAIGGGAGPSSSPGRSSSTTRRKWRRARRQPSSRTRTPARRRARSPTAPASSTRSRRGASRSTRSATRSRRSSPSSMRRAAAR